MKNRLPQIESTLKRIVAEIVAQRLADPRLGGLVSVTRVAVSPDLHDAYIYISVLPPEHGKRALSGLRHASGHVRALAARAMTTRSIPRLEFRLDEGLKRQAEVDAAIHRGRLKPGVAIPADEDPGRPAGDTPEEPLP
jgi:ribosome-binding factor A